MGARLRVLCPWYRAMSPPPDATRRNFARRVARTQRVRGLSTDDLAERAEIDRVELDRILRAEGPVRLDTVLLLAGALGVEPGELLEGIAWVADGEGGGEYRVEKPGD
jgi:transcriptional regulator with XRE-family HTH domain